MILVIVTAGIWAAVNDDTVFCLNGVLLAKSILSTWTAGVPATLVQTKTAQAGIRAAFFPAGSQSPVGP